MWLKRSPAAVFTILKTHLGRFFVANCNEVRCTEILGCRFIIDALSIRRYFSAIVWLSVRQCVISLSGKVTANDRFSVSANAQLRLSRRQKAYAAPMQCFRHGGAVTARLCAKQPGDLQFRRRPFTTGRGLQRPLHRLRRHRIADWTRGEHRRALLLLKASSTSTSILQCERFASGVGAEPGSAPVTNVCQKFWKHFFGVPVCHYAFSNWCPSVVRFVFSSFLIESATTAQRAKPQPPRASIIACLAWKNGNFALSEVELQMKSRFRDQFHADFNRSYVHSRRSNAQWEKWRKLTDKR